MGADELHEHATECKRYVSDQPVFIATEIKDDTVVVHEVDRAAELPLYFGGICLLCFGGNREPGPDRRLRMRVTRPEFPQRPTGDHLHSEIISRHQTGDNRCAVVAAYSASTARRFDILLRSSRYRRKFFMVLRRTTRIVCTRPIILLDLEKLNRQEWHFFLSAKRGTLRRIR
jgi:hypothetical protein